MLDLLRTYEEVNREIPRNGRVGAGGEAGFSDRTNQTDGTHVKMSRTHDVREFDAQVLVVCIVHIKFLKYKQMYLRYIRYR